ncbi:MAG TPA: hypothetical protein VFB25_04440 [Gaiellaceae bacterium]|nr:hypothetical protein [Gaiellaceae bacterium]
MTRLAVLLAAASLLLLPGSLRAAACSPLDCAPSQFVLAHGTLLATRGSVQSPLRVIDLRTGRTRWRLPPGIVQGQTLLHQDGKLVTWYDAATGARTGSAVDGQHAAFELVGASQRATRAVLARTQRLSTTFVVLAKTGTSRTITLPGKVWSFDALSGRFLYLIQVVPDGYEVRLYDLAANKLQPQPLKDPHEGALIEGAPFARASTPNGRYLFTLYVGSGTAMVHELDLAAGRAYCIDLPGYGDYAAAITWTLVSDVDNSTVWAVSPGFGRVLAIDVQAHVVRFHYSFQRADWLSNPGIGVQAPDGGHIAFTDGRHVWLAIPDLARVVAEPAHVATALAFAPDQSALWVVGERSRVSRLTPLRWK